jgi:hypothetical protein
MKLLWSITLLSAVLIGRISFAGTYYVATDGDNSNDCAAARDPSTPKRNIAGENGGLSCLKPGNGDILDVRAGTYSDRILSVVSGTSFDDAAIIRAHRGETVTLTGGIGLEGPAYVIFDGFTVTTKNIWVGSTTTAENAGHHIRFMNFDVSGINDDNLVVISRFSHHVEFIGGYFHGAPYNSSSCSASGTNSCYAFYISGQDNVIEGAIIYSNASYGIHNYVAGSAEKPDRNIYRYNEFYDNGSSNDEDSAALLLGSGEGNQAYGNIVRDNYRDGMVASNGATNSKIYNNTVYHNNLSGLGYGGIVWGSGSSTTIKNNIVYDNVGSDLVDSTGAQTPTFASNLCTGNGMGCSLSGDPLFADPKNNDFTLLVGSPAKRAGTPDIAANLSWSFVPDIGAMPDLEP